MKCRNVKVDRLVELLSGSLKCCLRVKIQVVRSIIYILRVDCLIRLKVDYLTRLFSLCCCENSFQSSVFRVQTMSISQSLFSHSALASLFECVWKSSFRLLIQFQFEFLQSFSRRKRCTEIFHVLDHVNDNVHVRTSLHCFVFWHPFEVWSWIILREYWIGICYFRRFIQCLSRSRRLRDLKFRQFHCAIAKLR